MASIQTDLSGALTGSPLNAHLQGKVAVVIGGAGAIGSAIAAALSKGGATVAIADASPSSSQVWSRIHNITGGKGRSMKVDLTNSREIESCFRAVHDEFGAADIMVHAAGIYVRKGLLEMSVEDWDQTLDINMRSFFLCTKAAVQQMMPKGEGRIIGITSGMGVSGRARSSSYSASKAAMIVFAKSIALELANTGITINCIGPGITDSPLMRNANTEEEMRQSEQKLGRPIGSPENVVGPVLYLLGEATRTVSGTTLWMRVPG